MQEIIREEMDAHRRPGDADAGAAPGRALEATGRYGIPELFKLNDRVGRDLVLAMTHEEIVALHAARELRTYRDLPQIWYHIQTKERDEPRPTAGVLRTREFTMKDSYTLDRDEAGLDDGYALHEEAYARIFARCGLELLEGRVGHRDDGRLGRARVHGALARRRGHGRALRRLRLRLERRDGRRRLERAGRPAAAPATEIETPGAETIEALAEFLSIDPRTTSKAMPVVTRRRRARAGARARRPAAARAQAAARCCGEPFRPAHAEEIEAAFGAKPGSIGPVGVGRGASSGSWPTRRCAQGAFVTGANRTGWHVTGVEHGRDYEADVCRHPDGRGGRRLSAVRRHAAIEPMIEVGNIFKLGTRYCEARWARRTSTRTATEQPIVMGSYGIGPARIVAAAIEQFHDDAGCIWPAPIAPFDVWMVVDRRRGRGHAERLADELRRARASTSLVDDRDEQSGRKFADADLIGAPDPRDGGQAHGQRRHGRRAPAARRRSPRRCPWPRRPSPHRGAARRSDAESLEQLQD